MSQDRMRSILALALPIIGGMTSQTILNLVDTLMVSQLGKEAIGAVGLGGVANFSAAAFITGMSAGVQAVAARRKGEGHLGETAVPLNGGLILVAAIAIPLSVVLFLLTPTIFSHLSSDVAVVAVGIPYLQSRIVSMVAVGANFAFRGYWNGVGLSRLYLRTLVVMHISNVVLSYGLIFGKFGLPEYGATGAGIGTTISTFIGTGYYFYLGTRFARNGGFLAAIPSKETIKSLFKLSVPSGMQQLLFAAGLTTLYLIVGKIGTNELAAAAVIMNISLVAFLPGLGLGLSAASLVGQALGRKDKDDAERWGWDVVKLGAAIMTLLGLPMVLFPEAILGAFLGDEPGALAVAVVPLRLGGATMAVEAMGIILLNAAMGAGATRLSMMISVGFQWLLFLPLAYVVGPELGLGLTGVWVVNVGYRALQAITCAVVWRRRSWASIEL